MTPAAAPPAPAPRQAKRPRIPLWARILVSLVALALVVWFVLVPQFSEAATTLRSLERVSVPLLLFALAAELASLLAYSALTASVFGSERPPYFTLLRLDLIDLGINRLVPGGATVATAARLQLFSLVGVRRARALSVTTIEITGANLMLGAILGISVVLSLTLFASTAWYLVAAILVAVLLAAAVFGTWALVAHPDRTVRVTVAALRWVPLLKPAMIEAFLREMSRGLRGLLTTPRRRRFALLAAALNWLLDAAALWIMLWAFGSPPPVPALLAIYAVGNLVAMLPITPGGLGIVEGFMVPALVVVGATHSTALLGVLGWRLLEYWMSLPLAVIGFAALLPSLRRGRRQAVTPPGSG